MKENGQEVEYPSTLHSKVYRQNTDISSDRSYYTTPNQFSDYKATRPQPVQRMGIDLSDFAGTSKGPAPLETGAPQDTFLLSDDHGVAPILCY